jgi:hypothetical protein
MKNIFFILLLLTLTSACSSKTFVRAAPDYSLILTKQKVASILPPEIEVNQVDALNKKNRAYNYEEKVEDIITDILVNSMRDKGYNISLLPKAKISTSKLSKDLVDTKDEFNDLMGVLYTDGAWSREKAYSIDYKIPTTMAFNQTIGTDLVVLLSIYSESKTSAAIAKDFTSEVLKSALISVATGGRSYSYSSNAEPAEVTIVRLAILNAANGQVLWTHSVSSSSNMISNTVNSFSDSDKVDRDRFTNIINIALKDLPPAN